MAGEHSGDQGRQRRGLRRSGRATLAVLVLLAGIGLGVLLWEGREGLPPVSTPPAAIAPSQWSEDELYGPCTVATVIDGDTVDVLCSGSKTRVRLLRVDTPEREQPGFAEARDALRRMVGHRPLHLVFEEPGVPSWGDYGRMLAYLVNERGENLNLEMVRQGWSPFYTAFGEGRFGPQFERAEAEARKRRSGMWGR